MVSPAAILSPLPLTSVVTVVDFGASTSECQVAFRLWPTSPSKLTSLSVEAVAPEEAEVEEDEELDALASGSEPLSDPEPQAARAGTRRTAQRAAAGRRDRRSTVGTFVWGCS